jgi:uncharacterized protein involved in response to NO
MTLAVMTRATLGHTGHALAASTGTCVLYASIVLSATLRVTAVFVADSERLLLLSAIAWGAAFLGYAALFGKSLSRPRR